jgi:hypothetical protein
MKTLLKDGKYIRAIELPRFPGRTTLRYKVESHYDGSQLGEIAWYGAWRGYAFFPNDSCIFESKCLGTICEWIDALNQAHKQQKGEGV